MYLDTFNSPIDRILALCPVDFKMPQLPLRLTLFLQPLGQYDHPPPVAHFVVTWPIGRENEQTTQNNSCTSLAITGLALLNGATIAQSLGIILLGGGLAWLIGSQFVLAGAMFHLEASNLGGNYRCGWWWSFIRLHQIQHSAKNFKRQAIYECEERNNFIANSPAECEKDPSVTTERIQGLPPGFTIDPTPDPWAIAQPTDNTPAVVPPTLRKAQPSAKRGRAVLERNDCLDLVVYDREQYAGGNPLVVDQLTKGDTVELLGHVTVGDEDIVKTPRGQRGFVSGTCLEALPVAKNDSEEHKPVAKNDFEEHKQWCSKHPLDDSCSF